MLVWCKTQLHLSILRSTSKIDDANGRFTSSFILTYFYKPRNRRIRIKVKTEIQLQIYWDLILNESSVDCSNLVSEINKD